MKLLTIVLMLMPGMTQAADVTVSQPWMRFLLPSLPASGYMILQNNSNTDEVLTSAASPVCGSLMLHESQDNSGMAMMMDVPHVDIPAHGSVAFAPGGYHLMCTEPKMKIGDKVPVTLTLQPGGPLSFTAPVYGATTSP